MLRNDAGELVLHGAGNVGGNVGLVGLVEGVTECHGEWSNEGWSKKCSIVPDEDADVGSGLAWF